MKGRERQLAGKRAKRADFQGSAPDSEKIPGVLGMQSGLNSVSMAMRVMEKALYSSYTPFLNIEWRSGAFAGSTPEQAYFVRCDRSTMTQVDIDIGRLVCEIGVAAMKPEEFVIFRIAQKTGDSE